MRTYINHFEIESKRPGEGWQHVGNIYPKYEWELRRPWYFFRLVWRPVITNSIDAFMEVMKRVTDTLEALEALPESKERTRLVVWTRRRFFGLTRVGVIE